MESYKETLARERAKSEKTRELRAAIKGLSAKQRREAIARAATMPLGDQQMVRHAIVTERAFPAVAAAVGQG